MLFQRKQYCTALAGLPSNSSETRYGLAMIAPTLAQFRHLFDLDGQNFHFLILATKCGM